MPSDILIIPNRNSTTTAPVMLFSGSQGNTIRLEVLTSGSVAFLGKSGSLFSISDNFSGSLMAVGDISGLPILEVFSDDRVVMGRFNSNALVVTGSNVGIGKSNPNPAARLDVSGSVFISGSTSITGSLTVSVPSGTAATFSTPGGGSVSFTNGTIDSNSSQFGFKAGSGVAAYIGANNSQHITVTTAGSVAIGKTTANAVLDVVGNSIITGSLNITGGITGSSGLGLFAGGSNTNITLTPNGFGYVNVVQSISTTATNNYALTVGIGSTSNTVSLGNHTDYAWLQSFNNRPLSINSLGNNVGIGTTAPAYPLQVNGIIFASGSGFSTPTSDTGFRLKFYDNGGINNDTGIGLSGSAGAETMWFNALNGFYFNYGTGGQRVTFDSSGNVAINKTTANARLDVNGDTIITGSLTVTGGVRTQGAGSDILHPFLFISFF